MAPHARPVAPPARSRPGRSLARPAPPRRPRRAGNLTWDGQFVYDAWNRLASVHRGWRDGGGTLQTGALAGVMLYDAAGRRVAKRVLDSGDWDHTYQYYHDGGREREVGQLPDAGYRYEDGFCVKKGK